MTPELWARLNPLLNAAVEKSPGNRDAFIVEACGDDLELRRELVALLHAHELQGKTTDKVPVNIQSLIRKVQPKFSQSDIVLGRFKIVRQLGSGGMGEVYEALDLELDQTVALKSIRPDIAENNGVLSRFKKEVQLARRLGGPNICRIHDLFVIPDGASRSAGTFLTMEFLDGVTLADKVHREGPIPWRVAQSIAADMCAGLSAMHEAGIIHRDLKSRNIMLANRGDTKRAVLMDFGLAREFSLPSATAETSPTTPGAFVGTPEYMAPEQFAGKDATPATDIYAMGIVLYEMLTGKHPFAAPDAPRAPIPGGKKPEPPSSIQHGVPRRWNQIIGKCLEFDPKRRYQSATELSRALRSHIPGLPRLSPSAVKVSYGHVWGSALGLSFVGLAILLWYKPASYHPPDLRALKWYEAGTSALQEGSYLQATGELKKAVELDKNFALAHARLAEAWSELDFTGAAEREMLLATAPEKGKNLPNLDRMYIEAVRATLTHDFTGAVQYEMAILKSLPGDQKGYGYVDLGRAQEKAGDIASALKSYQTAAKLNPDNPAPFIHLGVLKSRQQDAAGGEAAFKEAESLYQTKSNLEGVAEVAFQRGHYANERGDSALARASLDKCLEMARQIPSLQLQVRTLTQLSNADYYLGQNDQAIVDANQAIELANRNGLEYWATDGLIREGNAYLGKRDFEDAEKVLEGALNRAETNQHAHLRANAELTLASIRDQQGKRDEELQFAQSALRYFRDYGLLAQASDATILSIRAQEGGGNFAQALQSGMNLLEIARKSNSQTDIELAQETVGGILLDLEQYPDALTHFQEALSSSKLTKGNPAYQELHCADALWRLGRYDEAEAMLRSIPPERAKPTDVASGIDLVRAEMHLSQLRFREAYDIAARAVRTFSDLPANKVLRFRRVEVVAEAELGRAKDAQFDAEQLLALAHSDGDADSIAIADLTQALVFVRAQLPNQAGPLAESARSQFSTTGQAESEWLSLLMLSETSEGQKDSRSTIENAKRSLDILNKIEHTWTSPVFDQYASRPDIRIALRQLSKLKAQ
jgi:serine/threonine protein kinase/Tfp pilus assembly protein PilF